MRSSIILYCLLLTSCLSENINGAKIRAGAFSDSADLVTILKAGGSRWTDYDMWVAWRGPATLRVNTGYLPCKDKMVVLNAFSKRDPKRRGLLAQTKGLSCLEKLGSLSGQHFVSHSSGVHWWRAWNRK